MLYPMPGSRSFSELRLRRQYTQSRDQGGGLDVRVSERVDLRVSKSTTSDLPKQ